MMSPTHKPRIAWLINLFDDAAAQHAHAAAVLRATAARLDAEVVPVYCLTAATAALADVPPPQRQSHTEGALLALLKEYQLPAGQPLVIALDDDDPSVKEKATALANALHNSDILFTVVHTQRRSAMDRFFVGSFSEKFFTLSSKPVLVLNPHVDNPDTYDRITFASDLSDESVAAFLRFLPLAAGLSAAVTIEHQIRVSELGAFMNSASSRDQYQRELADARLRADARVAPMLAAAADAGVPVDFAVHQESASDPSGQGFEERAADAQTPMLAISAHGQRPWPGSIGSTALWLMRHAERPVLVMPPGDAR